MRIDLDDPIPEGWREIEIFETWYRKPTEVPVTFEAFEHKTIWDGFVLDLGVRCGDGTRMFVDPQVKRSVAEAARRAWLMFALEDGDCYVIPDKAFIICHEEFPDTRIDFLCVHPDHRRRGHGASLIQRIAYRFPGRGIIASTARARYFYKDQGFELVKRQRTLHK